MAYVDEVLNFKNCGNAEIMSEWFVLGINVGYEDIKPSMEAFLTKVGRRKFLKPIYSALAETPNNKAWAIAVSKKRRAIIITFQKYFREILA